MNQEKEIAVLKKIVEGIDRALNRYRFYIKKCEKDIYYTVYILYFITTTDSILLGNKPVEKNITPLNKQSIWNRSSPAGVC